MTRTISLIIGIAVTALVVAVPTAFGEGRLAGSNGQDSVKYFYANERATLASSQVGPVVSRPDSHELVQSNGTLVSRPDSHEIVQPFTYMDAAERAARISSAPGRDVVLLSGDDHITFQPADTSTPVASSGRDVDWPQVGIGFGIGIALALGLLLALRATRQRPLAH
ncbi:MAG TPA: hypothetical protein VHI53_03555 [Gaiellaceae bacterium]|jgi:hypothetical protein|nr:hypothetical protein [Gaiellaceae bacterium]